MLALDIDYDDLYTCKLCKDSGETVVMDGKEMGISKALSRAYARPLAADTRVVPVTRSALSLFEQLMLPSAPMHACSAVSPFKQCFCL